MKKFFFVFSAFIILSGQLVKAQESDPDQDKLFDHLAITRNMSQKQRTDRCADALKSGREVNLPTSLQTGIGLVGAGTVAILLGNAQKSQLSKFRIAAHELDLAMWKTWGESKLALGDYGPVIRQYEDEVNRALVKIKLLSGRSTYLSDSEREYNMARLKDVEKSVAETREQFSNTFRRQIEVIKVNPTDKTPFLVQIKNQMKLQDDVAAILKSRKYGDSAVALRQVADRAAAVRDRLNAVKSTREGVEDLTARAYHQAMYESLVKTENQMTKSEVLLKNVGKGTIAIGAVVSLYSAYSIFEGATDSTSGPYSLKTATLGNVRAICQKAVGDDSDSSAVHSVNSVLDFAAAIKGYSVAEEVGAHPAPVAPTDGKSAK